MKKTCLFLAAATLASAAAPVALADSLIDNAAPRKWITPYLPEKLPQLEVPDYVAGSPVEMAEAEAFAGRYKKSLQTAARATHDDPIRVALVVGQSNWALERVDAALAALKATPAIANDPRVQVLTARILIATDKSADAIALLKSTLQGHPDLIAARYWLGKAYESVGDIASAKDQYAWFVTPPHNYLDLWAGQSDTGFDNAEEVTTIGRAIDRWATLTSAYKDQAGLHNIVLNMFVKAYDVIDRTYWPAHVAAAEYYIDRDQPDKAAEELEAANDRNPHSADVDRLLGEMMLPLRQFDKVEQAIASLREVNPESTEADVLEARLDLMTTLRDQGGNILKRVLAQHPHRLDVIGLLAGYAIERNRPQDADALLKQADAISPTSGEAYQEAGLLLATANMNKPAVDALQRAIDREPWSTRARNMLGIVLLHSGEDDQARATLEAAYTLDPYNVATVNYLRLLDDESKFLRTETDHFIFIYAPIDDPIVPKYFAPYMEQAYKEVTAEFKFEPPEKTIIAVYPDSQRFSVRVSGMPGFETFAATFGRLIVAAAPRAGINIGPFNWGRVLKHEFAHVVHLTETDARVPRWLTEGLAVMSEHVDYRFDWVPPEMYKRATQHKLFTVAEMNQVYARPKGGIDGEMAYMTGFWLSQYMQATYGDDTIDKLLHAYKDGGSDSEAFVKATGTPLHDIEKGFADWAAKKVANWGYDQPTQDKYDAAFKHGDELIAQSQFDQAVEVFQSAAKLQPMNSQPHRRLAGLYLKLNRYSDALPELESLIPLALSDDRFAKRIATICRDAGDTAKAVTYGETAVQIDPYDASAHDLLADLYAKAGQADRGKQETQVAQLLRDRKTQEKKADESSKAE